MLIERGRTDEARRQCPAHFGADRPHGLDQQAPAQFCPQAQREARRRCALEEVVRDTLEIVAAGLKAADASSI